MANVLVTGGLGFIGSHLVDKLIELGDDVWVIDNLSTGRQENKNKKAMYTYENILEFLEGEYCNFTLPKKLDIIYHLAAVSRINPSFKYPLETLDVNIQGTGVMCDLALEYHSKLIYAGSSTQREEYLNPYAFSKSKGEDMCRMYSKVFGLKTAIARFYNVYGYRQLGSGEHATALGVFERQFMEEKPLTVTGTGEQKRDFTHVSDIINALIQMSNLEKLEGQSYELGRGKNYSMNEIASFFKRDITYIDRPRGEMEITLADTTMAKNDFGFNPVINIEDYIKGWIHGKQAME